ncbi:uncharacterized protein STEHIDRAFT_171973 [Stereum hirsutum FP-91666 SS1]|uniref:uncharacterized protein n=1 Tax=Stereum hirsutum (strain FP-91666) TaxID=721885 RepID=UPI000444A593|nr:uncharacterized protein STEHIDRAFT_171973 [Stereum hirsutum FP-91666 SS1]EIM81694.1 hypothetical protein STEHIDRAFT_171973 [Stereum hirsutum FP-91666 SS1]
MTERVLPGQTISESPIHSPDDSNNSSDTESLSELEESVDHLSFGHPLERMVPVEPLNDSDGAGRSSFYQLPSRSSSCSSTSYFVDYEAVIDEYLSTYADSNYKDLVFVQSDSDCFSPACSLIIKRMSTDSQEAYVLAYLNSDEVRQDPWNPAPRVLYAAERGDETIVCMERLFEFDQPPFQTVGNVIEFIRQTLEGLAFLHENRVILHSYGDLHGTMMDIGGMSPDNFDRTKYPVRYYRINFSKAEQLEPGVSAHYSEFHKDVQDCGATLERMLLNVPKAGPKLKSLVNAMKGGGFGGEDSRKLFEALCKTISHDTYSMELPESSRNSSSTERT